MNNLVKIPFHTLVFILGALFFLFGMIVPIGKKFYRYQTLIKQQELRLQTADIAVGQLPLIVKEMIQSQTLLNTAQTKFFFQDNNMSALLTLINENLKGLNLKVNLVKPEPQRKSHMLHLGKASSFYFLPVLVHVAGTYKDISNFIGRMIKTHKLCLIQNLKTSVTESPDHIEAHIVFNIAMHKHHDVPLLNTIVESYTDHE